MEEGKEMRTTPKQRAALAEMRVRLAETGCRIMPVAKRHRAQVHQFIAVATKTAPRHMLIVTPRADGTIVVNTYAQPWDYRAQMHAALSVGVSLDIEVLWSSMQIPMLPDGDLDYMRKADRSEFYLPPPVELKRA